MAKSLQEKNQMPCNKEARARYNSGYNKKMGLKMLSVRFKEEEIKEIDDYCKNNDIPKTELIRNIILDYIRK